MDAASHEPPALGEQPVPDEQSALVAERYARFARDEAPGRSALYEEWAAGVAATPTLASLIARLPAHARQPPLVFAVTRMLGAPERGFDEWRRWVQRNTDRVVAEASHRTLQTNEPLRCAALLPALAAIDGPIALIEVGAAAGLCMIPERYSYAYSDQRLDPRDGASAVLLECESPGLPPVRMPDIAWRVGIDLAPLRAGDADDRRFLTSLVWPGERGRAARISGALEIAARADLEILRADAANSADLRRVIESAPDGLTVVVTTPGVTAHIPRAGRESLAQTLRASSARWISIDPPWMHPEAATPERAPFVLTLDGDVVAAVDPLGARVEWRRGA